VNVQWYIDNRLVHETHTSERRAFRGCRRRWHWIFRESYYPRITAKPLEFGAAYHEGMEVFYNPETWDWPRDVRTALAIKAFVDKCHSQKVKTLEASGQYSLDEEVEEDYCERVELGKGMIDYYCNQISPREDKGWKPVRVEVEFIVDIPHPETGETIWCTCDVCWEKWIKKQCKGSTPEEATRDRSHWKGLPVVYAGRLDVLAQDEYGGLWIIDWKTARSIPEKYQFLYLDDQVGSYPWALRRLGLNVQGFIYHAQRKGFPQPPKMNKQRRLGCWYSVNKNQDVDYETYLATIQEHDHDAWKDGHYDEMLRFLKEEGIVYFARHQIHKTDEELAEIERNIGLEALDMINPDLRIYPSPGRFACDFCAFQAPCIEMNARGDYQYALDTMFEKRPHYYIREEPSTENRSGE
jgi:hypothetical protein